MQAGEASQAKLGHLWRLPSGLAWRRNRPEPEAPACFPFPLPPHLTDEASARASQRRLATGSAGRERSGRVHWRASVASSDLAWPPVAAPAAFAPAAERRPRPITPGAADGWAPVPSAPSAPPGRGADVFPHAQTRPSPHHAPPSSPFREALRQACVAHPRLPPPSPPPRIALPPLPPATPGGRSATLSPPPAAKGSTPRPGREPRSPRVRDGASAVPMLYDLLEEEEGSFAAAAYGQDARRPAERAAPSGHAATDPFPPARLEGRAADRALATGASDHDERGPAAAASARGDAQAALSAARRASGSSQDLAPFHALCVDAALLFADADELDVATPPAGATAAQAAPMYFPAPPARATRRLTHLKLDAFADELRKLSLQLADLERPQRPVRLLDLTGEVLPVTPAEARRLAPFLGEAGGPGAEGTPVALYRDEVALLRRWWRDGTVSEAQASTLRRMLRLPGCRNDGALMRAMAQQLECRAEGDYQTALLGLRDNAQGERVRDLASALHHALVRQLDVVAPAQVQTLSLVAGREAEAAEGADLYDLAPPAAAKGGTTSRQTRAHLRALRRAWGLQEIYLDRLGLRTEASTLGHETQNDGRGGLVLRCTIRSLR